MSELINGTCGSKREGCGFVVIALAELAGQNTMVTPAKDWRDITAEINPVYAGFWSAQPGLWTLLIFAEV
jgi:hypothetical protein